MPTFTTTSELTHSPEVVWDWIFNLDNWTSFTGHGPVPGILSAEVPGGVVHLGSRILVNDADGTSHYEVVTRFERPHAYTVRMELGPPASYLMDHVREDLSLEATPTGCRLTRTFVTVPRIFLLGWWVFVITHFFLRPAVDKHNANAAKALAAIRLGAPSA